MSNKETEIWQVLFESPVTGDTTLHSWWTDQNAAAKVIERDDVLSNVHCWIELGTTYISRRCQCCGSIFCTFQYDFYGNRAGFWCMDCYDSDQCTVQKTAYSDNS